MTNEPDLESISITHETVPWSSKTKIKATFKDPRLKGMSVMVIADTIPVGFTLKESDPFDPARITTMVWDFPRKILPEVNTHRVFSRNSASSRARSIKTTIRQVMTNPYLPTWTLNRKGMTGEYAPENKTTLADRITLEARDFAVVTVLKLLLGSLAPADIKANDWEHWVDVYNEKVYNAENPNPAALSIHKQDVNRYLEPWMWHETLVTSTYWKNFLDLRISDSAEPSIHALAVLVKAAMLASSPEESWIHLPFTDDIPDYNTDFDSLEEACLESASECARISYKNRTNFQRNDNTALGRRLLNDKHMSPFEHIAFDKFQFPPAFYPAIKDKNTVSNLSESWIQYRHVVAE